MSSRLPIGGARSTFRADRSHDKKILESAKLLSLLQRRTKRNESKQADDHILLSDSDASQLADSRTCSCSESGDAP